MRPLHCTLWCAVLFDHHVLHIMQFILSLQCLYFLKTIQLWWISGRKICTIFLTFSFFPARHHLYPLPLLLHHTSESCSLFANWHLEYSGRFVWPQIYASRCHKRVCSDKSKHNDFQGVTEFLRKQRFSAIIIHLRSRSHFRHMSDASTREYRYSLHFS